MPLSEHNNSVLSLTVEWSGSYQFDDVLKGFNDGGIPSLYDGIDYGLYQIYGNHILIGSGTLR